jgi:hypothetical protein
MAVNRERAKVTQEKINSVIDAGGSVPGGEEKVDIKDDNFVENNDVRFTVTMPYELASVIDRLRKPSKTSRQAWLMQAAIDKLKKDGEL